MMKFIIQNTNSGKLMNLQLFPSKFIGPLSARCSHKEHDEILNKKVRAIVYSLPLATREKEDHKGLSSTGCSIRKLPQAILCDLFSHGIKKLEFFRRPLIPLRDPCASIVQPPSVAFVELKKRIIPRHEFSRRFF